MLEKLEKRFNENMKFHSNLTWNDVAKKIDDVVLKKLSTWRKLVENQM